MDAKEFLATIKQASNARRSRLEPFLSDIIFLQKQGCTLEIICQFLKQNDVEISTSGLSAYIKRRGNKNTSIATINDVSVTKNEGQKQNNKPKFGSGFHQILEEIEKKNSSTDPRRNS